MRRLLPLVLLLAACTSVAGNTTTTAPVAEPSTTTTVPSTTTTGPTSATTEEGCVERVGDGVLRNRRGFVCPPHLVGWDGTQFNPNPPIHLPGSYETRAFAVPLSFVAPVPLPSNGDSNSLVQIFQGPNDDTASSYPPRSSMRVWTDDAAAWIATIPESAWDWGEATDVTLTEVTVGGLEGARHDFTCHRPEGTDCVAGDLTGIPIGYRHGQHVTIIDVATPAGQAVFEVFADPARFDEFWTEVAGPILDSIEFLDQ